MKRFSKILLALAIVALSLPLICNPDTAMAKKAKKLTAEQVLDQMQQATAKKKSITVSANTDLELTAMSSLPISLKQELTEDLVTKKDGSISLRCNLLQNLTMDENLKMALGESAANLQETMEVALYLYLDDTGISVYVKADGKWNKVVISLEDLMTILAGEEQTTTTTETKAAKKSEEPWTLKLKEGKKKYTITMDITLTEDVMNEIAQLFSQSEDTKELAQMVMLAASDKSMCMTFVVDKKTMLLKNAKLDFTDYANDVLSNVMTYLSATDSTVAQFNGKINVSAAKVAMTYEYGKVKSIKLPKAAADGQDYSQAALEVIADAWKSIASSL